jgi:hypothetical protein
MKRISKVQLDQMKSFGYEDHTILNLLHIYERGQKADDLENKIKSAFSKVLLGDGVGLMQAQALSDFKGEEVAKSLRDKDEKNDWKQIPSSVLIENREALFFFDALGMRFYLPAFLCSELRGDYEYPLVINLTRDFHLFSEFNANQKLAVRDVLSFFREQQDYKQYEAAIAKALQKFWCESITRSRENSIQRDRQINACHPVDEEIK